MYREFFSKNFKDNDKVNSELRAHLEEIKGKADIKADTESKQLKTINDVYLFNYFDLEEIELFKKKLFEKATDEERELRN